MTTATVDIPDKLVPVFMGEADVRGAWGGRGSAKTRTFAKMTAVRAYMWAAKGEDGLILCARQFMNSLADSSLEEIKAAIRSEEWLTPHFDIGEKYIRTAPHLPGRIDYGFTGLDRNVDSVKSKARIRVCWIDEAEPVTEEAYTKLDPTLREEDSELWVTWNPERKGSPTDKRFRRSTDERTKIVEMNWRDNPWFPDILERKRLKDRRERPDQYEHIWEGDYITVAEGAYYARQLTQARDDGRMCRPNADPLMTIRAVWDIGGTGSKADATAIWIAQFVGTEVRLLDYYEAVGQPLAAHVEWLRDRGYAKAQCVLPHDGAAHDRVYDATYEGALKQAGFDVVVIPNQGTGAAMRRIEAARRLFPQMWFHEDRCAAGIEAIGWYHEKRDEARGIGLGPNHDWSSHGCFVGETEVLTRYGIHRIDSLEETGEVLTPCGWKPYILPRITRTAAPLVEVAFTDGHSVKCTPDHLFLTESGWKSAESLRPNTVIRSTLTKSRSISMAGYTVCGLARRTYRGLASAFTAPLGWPPSALFRSDAIFTTGTATSSTTALKISNACQHLSICQILAPSGAGRRMGGSLIPRGTRLPSGILHLREGFGTSATLKSLRVGRSGSAKSAHATIAAPFTWLLSAKAEILASIAGLAARLRHTVLAALRPNTSVVIASVRPLNETADVWDITVPDGHCFSLRNGAVVHNSDAFGLVAVARPLLVHTLDEIDEYDRAEPDAVTGY